MTISETMNTEEVPSNSQESDDSSSSEDVPQIENEDADDENDLSGNAGWADSIARILKTNKPKHKKTLVLSKAKVLTEKKPIEKPKPAGYEVEKPDGEVIEEKIEVPIETETKPIPRKKKSDLKIRVKPNIRELDKERLLAKVATKGVVQLFNAVRTQQNEIRDKLSAAGPLEIKKDKALKTIDKNAFLNVLMGEKTLSTQSTSRTVPKSEPDKSTNSTWNVFRDDFLMGAKMKDWDKQVEEETDIQMETE